jgi:hypothetical protein
MHSAAAGRARLAARIALAVVAGAVVAVTGGCGAGSVPADGPAGEGPASAIVVRAPAPTQGDPAAPQGKVLLTVTGRISVRNDDGRLLLDQAELDRLGLLQVSVYDPWAKRRLELQGVWLTDLVDRAGPDAAASSLRVRALDDYQVDLALADVRAGGIFLATRTGTGGEISLEDGGPTRVVFTDDVAARYSPDQWIWNIDTIEVR